MNSKVLGRKTEKHEIQMVSCDGELKADEYWMSAETSWIRDIAERYGGWPVYKALKVKIASFCSTSLCTLVWSVVPELHTAHFI